jgi:peptidoglycan/LPS O-acetylase OafA/YrhL
MRNTDNSTEPVTGESGSRERKNRVPEFEGLRGILASWVILGHILLFSGFTYTAGLSGILFSPVLGVYVFMMLSGFVVTSALDAGSGNWSDFMRRRIFRIYPVYLICLALSILMIPVSRNVASTQSSLEIGRENSIRLQEVSDNFGIYAVADLLLLQNLMPREQFPHAHETFLPPTWSLSLEWMFYLVMPFLFGLLRRRGIVRLAGLAAVVAFVLLSHDSMTRICPSLNLATASYFLTGIASYSLWKWLPVVDSPRFASIAFWIAILSGIALLPLSFKVWFAVMGLILYDRFHRTRLGPLELVRSLLNSQPAAFLGRISYSGYLVHWIVIEVCLFLGAVYFPQIKGNFSTAVFCCLTVFPLTYAASHLLFKYVEAPMIRLGSKSNPRAHLRGQLPATEIAATPPR